MAYRAPRYSYHHAGRDAGPITISDSAAALYPLDNLTDDRNGTVFMFDGVVTDPTLIMDLTGSFVAEDHVGFNRVIIPANHSILTIKVDQADDLLFTQNVELLHDTDISPTPSTLYDSGEFDTAASTRRFIRFTFVGTSVFFMAQLILTKIKELTVGPDLENSPDGYRANVTRLLQNDGQSPTILHGPQQRVIEYSYAPVEGADLAILEELIAIAGMDKPFYIDPASFSTPPETDEPPLIVKFDEMPDSRHTILVPKTGVASKAFVLRMIESVD